MGFECCRRPPGSPMTVPCSLNGIAALHFRRAAPGLDGDDMTLEGGAQRASKRKNTRMCVQAKIDQTGAGNRSDVAATRSRPRSRPPQRAAADGMTGGDMIDRLHAPETRRPSPDGQREATIRNQKGGHLAVRFSWLQIGNLLTTPLATQSVRVGGIAAPFRAGFVVVAASKTEAPLGNSGCRPIKLRRYR